MTVPYRCTAHRPTVIGGTPDAAAHARGVARDFLSDLSPAVESRVVESVELVVSELVTNAIRHAHGRHCTLDLDESSDGIAVVVEDSDPVPPRQRAPDLNGESGGFGWPIVCSLARDVSVTTRRTGKSIRVVVPRTGSAVRRRNTDRRGGSRSPS